MVSSTWIKLGWFSIALVFASSCASAPKGSDPTKKTPREKATLLVEAANAAMLEGDPIGALQFLKTAEETDSKFSSVYHAKALAFNMRKDLPQALIEMKKAADLDPENSSVNNTYGKLLMDAGRAAEAEKHLKKAASDSTFRESYKARTSLGILYYRQNQLDLADQNLERASFDDPANSCIAYYYRGHVALKRGKLMDATKYYERATQKLCAGFADAHFALGVAYERDKKFDQARKKYLEVKQNFPESKVAEQAMQLVEKLP